jgi:RNA polymerase sigma-70 factor (ECF subfamily)
MDEPRSAPDDSDPATWAGLMAAAQDGDRQAYGRLLIAILPTLRSLVARNLRDRADVEDTVQDILLSVHEARASFDPSRPFKPWLFGIARFRLIDRMRVRSRMSARETPIEAHHETFSSVAPKQDDMTMDRHALHAALAQLPAGQRAAVEDLKLREQSLQEVSARTGMSITALKVATHRGMKRLRVLLAGKDSP